MYFAIVFCDKFHKIAKYMNKEGKKIKQPNPETNNSMK